MKQRSLVNTGYISPEIAWVKADMRTKEERKSERDIISIEVIVCC